MASHTQQAEATPTVALTRTLAAEFAGTFVLVFGGTGSAILAVSFASTDGRSLGIGFAGVAAAFGLAVITMAYAVGNLSGGHFNPAVTIGLAAIKRFAWRGVPAYIGAQLAGAVTASSVLWIIAVDQHGTTRTTLAATGFAANGYQSHSPGGYGLVACLITEIVLSAVFVTVVAATTAPHAPKNVAPLAIGLTLTLIHLVSIPVTNTSVNPARSTGPAAILAVAGHAWALGQLWMFWLAPILGGVIGAVAYRQLTSKPDPTDES